MSNADTHAELHSLFNDRDIDSVLKRMSDDITYTDHARGMTMRGQQEVRGWLEGWVSSLDGKCTEMRYIDAGDTSIALFVGRGTQNGPLGPFPPSGRDVAFDLCEILRYDADGTVIEGEIYFDQVGVLAQLGHIDLPQG